MAQSFLYAIDVEYFTPRMLKLVRRTLESGARVCYVSINKTGEWLHDLFERHALDTHRIIIVDMVSSRFRRCDTNERIVCCDVTEPARAVTFIERVALAHKCDVIIVDYLSSIRAYYDETQLLEFSKGLLTRSREHHCTTFLLIQRRELDTPWAHKLTLFVDQYGELEV